MLNLGSEATISVWTKISSYPLYDPVTNINWAPIIIKSSSNFNFPTFPTYELGIIKNDKYRINSQWGGNNRFVEVDGPNPTTPPIPLNEWYMITTTFKTDGTTATAKMYIDGKLSSTRQQNSAEAIPTTTDPLYIGGRPTTLTYANDFDGILDELVIFNRSLTDSEIQQIYNSQK